MATYVPNATQTTEPTEDKTVESAALEFRTLKTRVNDLETALEADDLSDLRVPEASVAVLPAVAARAGKVLGFDAGGDPTMVEVAGATDPSLRSDLADPAAGASLVGYHPAGTGAVATTVQAKLRESVSVKDFGAIGDGVADDTLAVQAAVTYCVQNRKALFVPAGTYIIRPATNGTVYLNKLTADYQGLTMFGEGRGKSIFKEGDGETAAGGRYTTMFYCWLDDPASNAFKYGTYSFRDLTFDKNGISNGVAPTSYEWEGAHIIKFQGNAGTASIDALTFERIELIDKVGAGIVAGPSDVQCRSLVLRDIQSTRHAGLAAGNYGGKGCIEVAIDSEITVIEDVNVLYSQIERTDTYDVARLARFNVSNSKIDTFEYTYTGTGVTSGNSNVFIEASGMTCTEKFLVRGVQINVSNSRLAIKFASELYPINMVATACQFLLPYNSGTFVVTSLYVNRPATWTVAPKVKFIGCDVLINSDTVDATTTGYLVRSNLVSTIPAEITFDSCYFDKRAYGVATPYSQGGDYTFVNCKMAAVAAGRAIHAGTYSTYVNSVKLIDCDFSNVAGTDLYVQQGATGYTLKVTGDYSAADWVNGSNSAVAVLPAQYLVKPRLFGTAAPVAGMWFKGDKVYNSEPAAAGFAGWICTTAGTPGTWKTFGAITA
jgi:hypothetical protein